MSASGRRGGILILVLICVTLLLALVLSSATLVRLRWALAAETFRRAGARDAALSAIAEALHGLAAQTHPVDGPDAAWRDPARTGGIALSDEESRLDLRTASVAALAALFSIAAELPPRRAEALAQALVAWRERESEPPCVLEDLLAAPGMTPVLLERIAPHATVHGSGRVNIHTAAEPVIRALLASVGASRDTQAVLLAGLRTARRQRRTCASAGEASLAALLLGPGRIPRPEQAQALAALALLMDVRSSSFRGVAETAAPRIRIAFVYDRNAGVFRRWSE